MEIEIESGVVICMLANKFVSTTDMGNVLPIKTSSSFT